MSLITYLRTPRRPGHDEFLATTITRDAHEVFDGRFVNTSLNVGGLASQMLCECLLCGLLARGFSKMFRLAALKTHWTPGEEDVRLDHARHGATKAMERRAVASAQTSS
jgi:hypothetical protein